MRFAEAKYRVLCISLLVLGCSGPQEPEQDEDIPADLPNEPTEFEGVLYGHYKSDDSPTQFWDCESGEVFEMSYAWQLGEVWSSSCSGVYNRVRGHIDRSFDSPRLVVEETLEARWSTPSDCVFIHEPLYESCAIDDMPNSSGHHTLLPCHPVASGYEAVLPNCGGDRCSPQRFDATEFAGWKDFDCVDASGQDGPGQPCEYSGDSDTCVEFNRCWNPDGDLTKPGVCVPYCDLSQATNPCAGECVRCSSSKRWGLCVEGCSGEDCNVDAFC